MKEPVPIETFLKLSEHYPVVDVRSPAEYMHAHIPGAFNVPLFDDEERKVIGTLYTTKGRKEAIIKGFEFAGRKSSTLVNAGCSKATENRLLVHCWRGGMRSGAMAWLFSHAGLDCEVLVGGYKSYRRFLRSFLQTPFKLIVLGGMTGSGKTAILREIANRGYQVLDLEKLANHKGSAFGALGEEEQPANEQFENNLLARLMKLDRNFPVWVEDESMNIGKNIIPREFFGQMRMSPVIVLEMDRALRAGRLVSEYGRYSKEELSSCIQKISRRIGGQHAAQAMRCLESGDYHELAGITLRYYDKSYLYGLTNRPPENIHYLKSGVVTEKENASLILDYCRIKQLL